MEMARQKSETRIRAIKVWNEVLEVGEKITATELADTLDLSGGTNRKAITGILVNIWNKGCSERNEVSMAGVRGRSKYRFTKLANYEPYKQPIIPKEERVVEPPAEVEEPEGRQHCIKCNSLFTPAELGESILKIIKEQHGLIMRQDKQGVEKGEEFRALVEEKAQLKKHIDKQAQLINEINEKLRKSTGKTIDLHALAEFRSHLPNEGKGKNVKAAAGN